MNFFCAEWYVQGWDIEGVRVEIRRSCLNAETITAVQPHIINGELHLIVTFNWQDDKSPTFVLKGADARRFLTTFRVQVPVDWIQSVVVDRVDGNSTSMSVAEYSVPLG